MKKITIIIPCHNEEKGIVKVLNAIPKEVLTNRGYEFDIMVVDNNSTDKTRETAEKSGARVIFEARKGKGNAVITGFQNIENDTKYVVMLDGDGTYLPSEIFRMIEPLESNFCHVVVGSRLGGKLKKKSLNFTHRISNWMITFLVRQFYLANVTDTLSGYFAFKRDVIKALSPHLISEGFSIEIELITKCVRLGFDVYSVPITYDQREGQSKLNGFSDGVKIIFMLMRNLFWRPSRELRDAAKSLRD